MEEIYQVHQIKENLWAIDEVGKTLMYLYAGEETALLLDTGFGLTDLKALAASLCPGKELVVVNSHGHGDHNSGNIQFDTVYVGRMDEPISHIPMEGEDLQRMIDVFIAQNPWAKGHDLSGYKPGPAKHVAVLTDGDIIDLGGIQLEVLECPGHTAGSICLWDAANGYLFTGDLILTWEVWGQLSTSVALKTYADSLNRMAALEPQVKEIFPAHGTPNNPYGWPLYHLDPHVLTIYAQGTQAIVDGKTVGEPYQSFGGPGLCAYFEVGGMVYDPERIGV